MRKRLTKFWVRIVQGETVFSIGERVWILASSAILSGIGGMTAWLTQQPPIIFFTIGLVMFTALAPFLSWLHGKSIREKAILRGTHKTSTKTEPETTQPSFEIRKGESPVVVGDYESVCALAITNVGGKDLENCLVKIIAFDSSLVLPSNMPTDPFVLRTVNQIKDKRSGRFNLSIGEHKAIPVLFYPKQSGQNPWNAQRSYELHFIDARGEHFRFTSPSLSRDNDLRTKRLKIGAYGGVKAQFFMVKLVFKENWNEACDITVKEITNEQTEPDIARSAAEGKA